MMKNTLFLAWATVLTSVSLYAQEKPYIVTVELGSWDAQKAVLNRYTLSTGQHKDTAEIKNGIAVFKGRVNNERQIGQVLLQGRKGGSAVFYLEPGKITVQFKENSASHFPEISGTPLNKDFQHYHDLMDEMIDSARNASKNPGLNQFSPTLLDNKFGVIRKFMAKYPASLISVDLLNQIGIAYTKRAEMLTQYEMLSAKVKASPQGKELLNRIKGIGAATVGNMAPDWTLPDMNGKNVSLSDYRGKYVLIDFWATWCAPCLQEMPNVVKAYDEYKDKNFEILGVSLDRPDSKELWLKKIKELNMTWPQVSDLKWWNSTAALLYNVNSAPASFLIDPKGKIIATGLRGDELQKKLEEVLATQ